MKLLQSIPQPVRAWTYRILFLVAVIAVAVAVTAGAEVDDIVMGATALVGLVGTLLAAANTPTGGGD